MAAKQKKRDYEAERLDALRDLDLHQGETYPELDRLTRLAADICGAETSLLSVFDDGYEIQLSNSAGGELTRKPRAVTFCNHTLGGRSAMLIPDAREDSRLADNPYVKGEPYVCSYAGVCIGAESDNPVGVICVIDTKRARFGEVEMGRLKKLAELVNSFLEQRLAAVRARRAAEKTQAERTRQLQFDLLFEAMHEGVNVYGADGRIIESNAAACDLLGLTRDQQLGRAYIDRRWSVVRPDGSPMPPSEFPIHQALTSGKIVRSTMMGVDLPSGERRWISVTAAPVLRLGTDEIEYGLVTFKDITRERIAEEELSARNSSLAAALDTAEKASRAKSDFISVMSHELRTPMNAVLGCATLLTQSRLDPVQTRTLGVLEDAGRQMLVLLNDLFDLASLDAAKVHLNPEPVALVRLIEDAAVIWASEVRAKGLTLSVMIDPKLVTPRLVDPARLLQIIGNLMANAIKFTAAGGVSIQAWPVKLHNGSERVEVEIEDTGPGVPEEAAARIFSPFEQGDVSTRRRHGGLGIGLHVARRLAMAMGGDVSLESRLGEGSRFTVRIDAPLAETGLAHAADKEEAPSAQAREVLCVDDNARNLYVLGAMLRAAGHRVAECASGAQALAELAARRFDVVLLDMVMPEMDGLEVLAALRTSKGPNRRTPVIACTANVQSDQVEAYLKAGTAGVLAKPIDIKAMLQAVAAA